MAQEYVTLRAENDLGSVRLNKTVFSSIASNVIEEDENVILAPSSTFKSGIVTKIEDNQLILNISVKINHKANVADVCADLQNKIFESISYMTEFKPESIEIQVIGFVF